MTDIAALVAPSVRWHGEYGYELAERDAATAIALGCRGVVLHGGPVAETTALVARLRDAAPDTLFVAAELGGGAGERFVGATALPPLAAFDAADIDGVRRASRVTAREAREIGVSWALSPSCVDPGSASPLARSRTFRGNDADVGEACAEWIDACQAEGVVATPGPYPRMRGAAAEAALESGSGAMLLAADHATDRATIAYLRNSARFEGVISVHLGVVSELRGEDEDAVAVACVAAGCDLLLGADDAVGVVQALRQSLARGALHAEEVRAAVARVDARTSWAAAGAGARRDVTLDDTLWARRMADAAIQLQRGRVHALAGPVDLIVVDDDPPRFEPAGSALLETLQKLDVDVRRVRAPSNDSRGPVVIALVGDRRIGLGFETFSDAAVARVRDAWARSESAARDAAVVHFTPPDFGAALDGVGCVVCAWSGTRAMEEAVARWLARGGV